MKKILSIILALALLIVPTTNVFAFQDKSYQHTNLNIIVSEHNNSIYTELVEEKDVLTFFYHDTDLDNTLVISQSNEGGNILYYNDGKEIYKISNLDNVNLKDFLDKKIMESFVKNFFYDFYQYKNSTVKSYDSVLSDNHNKIGEDFIKPLGLPDVESRFYREVGRPFKNKFVASANIENKASHVLETKDVSIRQVTKLEALAGEVFAFILSYWKMPKSVAIAIGIATVIRAGVEYIKEGCLIIKYSGKVNGNKDIFVQNILTHQVSCGSSYEIWENTRNNMIDFQIEWDWEGADYRDNYALMKTAVGKYFD